MLDITFKGMFFATLFIVGFLGCCVMLASC